MRIDKSYPHRGDVEAKNIFLRFAQKSAFAGGRVNCNHQHTALKDKSVLMDIEYCRL